MHLQPSPTSASACEQAVRLLLPAEQELFDAACYYEKQASGLGQDFLNGIETALRHILEAPHRWPVSMPASGAV